MALQKESIPPLVRLCCKQQISSLHNNNAHNSAERCNTGKTTEKTARWLSAYDVVESVATTTTSSCIYFVVNNKCNWLKSVWLQLKVDFKFCYAEMSEYCCVANEFGILCAQYYRNWSKFVKTTNRVTILFLDHS